MRLVQLCPETHLLGARGYSWSAHERQTRAASEGPAEQTIARSQDGWSVPERPTSGNNPYLDGFRAPSIVLAEIELDDFALA